MAKAVVTDPEQLQPTTFPKGTYTGVLEDCSEKIGTWGDFDDVQRFTWVVSLDGSVNPEFEGKMIRETTPCDSRVPGSFKFYKFVAGLKETLETFDSDTIGQPQVQIKLSEYKNRSGERQNGIDTLVLAEV